MRALEFFSGIGGLHYGLVKACPQAVVVAAFDINNTANAVYAHNLGLKPLPIDVCALAASKLDDWGADVWLMSPPCQPYTRRGLNLQSADARAEGFLSLLRQLPAMQHRPRYVFLENVVGFEASDTRCMVADTLKAAGYSTQEFIVSPTQLGIPYSRPRYFCLAKRHGTFALPNRPDEAPFDGPPSVLLASKCREMCPSFESTSVAPLSSVLATAMHCDNAEGQGDLSLSEDILWRHGWCLDIVGPDSTRVNCITKAYSHFMKGSGSVLATTNSGDIPQLLESFPTLGAPQARDQGATEALVSGLLQLNLRFFSPAEIAALHSFPKEFEFPKGITRRQAYALLGNSVNVSVVEDLLGYLLSV